MEWLFHITGLEYFLILIGKLDRKDKDVMTFIGDIKSNAGDGYDYIGAATNDLVHGQITYFIDNHGEIIGDKIHNRK